MRLLVSVRSAAEAEAAVLGGADVVDAKEPERGSLGPVAPAALRAIAASLPVGAPLSAALGDFVRPEQARVAVESVPRLPGGAGAWYLKLGFGGVADPATIERVMEAAVAAAQSRGDGAVIVAAAYADHHRAGSAAPEAVARAAARRGAAGVLVDTWGKDGWDLFHWMPLPRLTAWVDQARAAGLLTAAAGSLAGRALESALLTGVDVVGVRGAVCEGGRSGRLTAERVRAIARLLRGRGMREHVVI